MKIKKINRRNFVKKTALGAGAVLISPHLVRGSKANSDLGLGLLGCGNRGTAVAMDFVNHTDTRIVALADLFEDQLKKGKETWDKVSREKRYAGVPDKNMFLGKEAFLGIANCKDVDVVIIASPDFFHVQHLEAVVEARKHIYCEKPAGVDVEGCLKFIELGEEAKDKLSLEIGFNIRGAKCFYEMVDRLHRGDIGPVSYGALHYHAPDIPYPEFPNASPLEKRIRRFYWDRILSGDTLVDQHIHMVDVANWVFRSRPLKAIGAGGRKARSDGSDIWDNWSICYTYPENIHVNLSAIQFGDFWDVGVRFIGKKGIGESNYNGMGRITGENAWSIAGTADSPGDFSTAGTFDGLSDSTAYKARNFVDSITSGNYHNQAREGAESALSAIMGRMAAYSGETVTWNEMIGSNQSYQDLIDLDDL